MVRKGKVVEYPQQRFGNKNTAQVGKKREGWKGEE